MQDHTDDVAEIEPLDEALLLANIRARYEEARLQPLGQPTQHHLIYTRAGPIIVAVNPWTCVDNIYSAAKRRAYDRAALAALVAEKEGKPPDDEEAEGLPPHIYEIAGKAHHQMREGACRADAQIDPYPRACRCAYPLPRPGTRARPLATSRERHPVPPSPSRHPVLPSHPLAEAVIINGESGAGKTETTKLLLQYLSEMTAADGGRGGSGSLTSLSSRLLASSPVLEAYGNAATLRNDNSSRFGKLIKLHFLPADASAAPLHRASIAHYLLEKSRVVTQQPGEQAYHIFYQILAGASPQLR